MRHHRPALPSLRLSLPLSLLLALLLGAAPAALASSATSSAASDGVSASVGSLSTSVEHSSDSSSKDDKVADGDYTVIEVAESAAGPERLRLTLQRDGARFFLHLPHETVARAGLAAGAIVAVRERDWGIEFAAGAPRRAFFLALHETWLPELQTRPLAL